MKGNFHPHFDSSNFNSPRRGFSSITLNQLSHLLQLPESLTIGIAVNDGGCFFDALAQALNALQNTKSHTEKSMRLACHHFYENHKALVNEWNDHDYGGIDKGEAYYMVQYTKPELDKDFHARSAPIWGRPHIEGRILCEELKLSAIHLIELTINLENNQLFATHFLITKEGITQSEDEKNQRYSQDIPIIAVSQKDLHFIPILPKNNFLKPKTSNPKRQQNMNQNGKRELENKNLQKGLSLEPKKKIAKTTSLQTNLENEDPLKPNYIITIPTFVPIDPNASSSDLESQSESENIYGFNTADVKHFPYTLDKSKRGEIDPTNYYSDDEKDSPNISSSFTTLNRLISIFEEEAFDTSENKSLAQAKERLGINFGLNRMRSVSKKRNKSLQIALNEPIEPQIPISRFGFFWKPYWNKIDAQTNTVVGKVQHEEVRAFYKWLKKYDEKHQTHRAKKFLEANEGKEIQDEATQHVKTQINKKKKTTNKSIPYRELRQHIKEHPSTRKLIEKMRQNRPDAETYMGIQDADILHLRKENQRPGAFSYYDEMIATNLRNHHIPLEIGSTGYRIDPRENPMLALGVEMDLWVRHYTSQFIKQGVYYPEPNSIIRLLPELPNLEADFKKTDGPNYASPGEMPCLIADSLTKRNFEPQKAMMFDAHGAVMIETPQRMKRSFSAFINRKGKMVRWTLENFETLRGINQSHFSNRDWALQILNAACIQKPLTLKIQNQEIILNDKRVIRDLLISAISRLYRAYDPIFIAEEILNKKLAKNENSNFQKELSHLLSDDTYRHYVGNLKTISPGVLDRKEGKRTEEVKKIWNDLDRMTDMRTLKAFINQLINSSLAPSLSADNIEKAAMHASQKIVEILKEKLSTNFTDLSFELAKSYFNELAHHVGDLDSKIIENEEIHRKLLEAMVLDDKTNVLKCLQEIQKLSYYGCYEMTPMHWAAIIGSTEMVDYLITKKNSQTKGFSDISAQANFNVLPLHCAIRYCADHGNAPALIEKLCNEHSIKAKTVIGLSPLLMTLKEVKNPLPIVKVLCEQGALPQKLHESLYQLITKASFYELQNPIVAALHFLSGSSAAGLIKEFMEQGADINAPGYLIKKDKRYFHQGDYLLTEVESYPIFEAIEKNDENLLQAILHYDPILTDIYDYQGRPPLFVAKDEAALSILSMLVQAGADVNEAEQTQDTLLLHEAIEPLDGSGFDEDLFDYLMQSQNIDLYAKDGADQTPLEVALDAHNEEAVTALLDRGVDWSDLPDSITASIRSLTGREIYNDQEMEELERQERHEQIKETIRDNPDFTHHPTSDDQLIKNVILQCSEGLDYNFDEILSESDDNSESDQASDPSSSSYEEDEPDSEPDNKEIWHISP